MNRAIGIALGVLLGVLIVVAFVFLGSEETIDDPDVSGKSEPPPARTAAEPGETAP